MNASRASSRRFLMLGPETGWHADQLRTAADRRGHRLDVAAYESLDSEIHGAGIHSDVRPISLGCERGQLSDYDAILTRTMPSGSMEKITFRLAMLHVIADRLAAQQTAIINPPRSLEWAIDKYASLARLAAAGFPTPHTRFVQSRREAMQAFDDLGQDCVVKPIFGGEGRGVMRVTDPQLAWVCFSTLEQLDALLQIQSFVRPGGQDTRLLVIGDQVFGIRRTNRESFRTNVSAGAQCQRCNVDDATAESAKRITAMFGLVFASVDLLDNEDGPPLFLEVNAIPGWKGAQSVIKESIADQIIIALANEAEKLAS